MIKSYKAITDEMLSELNKTLEEEDCIFRFKASNDDMFCRSYELELPNKKFIDSFIINPSDDFYKFLESFFNEKDIKISWNNAGSIFWARVPII